MIYPRMSNHDGRGQGRFIKGRVDQHTVVYILNLQGVFGACSLDDEGYLLIVDPHHVSPTGCSASQLVSEGWVKWVSIEQFSQDSFYNLCLPQVK